jgi:zinc protease
MRLSDITLSYANGVRVILKPTDFKNDEVRPVRATAVSISTIRATIKTPHLIGGIERNGVRHVDADSAASIPDAKSANAVCPSNHTRRSRRRVHADDVTAMLQLLYLKMTAPRLDPAGSRQVGAQVSRRSDEQPRSPVRRFHDVGVVAEPSALRVRSRRLDQISRAIDLATTRNVLATRRA